MVENKFNWNTILVILVVGVVGILLLNNSGILTGNVTGSIDSKDKQVVLTMLNKCTTKVTDMGETCNSACPRQLLKSTCISSQVVQATLDPTNRGLEVTCDYSASSMAFVCTCCLP